ncbi:MAG: type II toxin-antitoxin system HicB family antitoxin [Methylobacteriaceae bacterium]|nr:type II toxin-antitoxin system HicB family antitoxin [Methylobacteriaceae bacterium]MBV9243810.1 type II toxin-antitoxin system HicB family antitoxin [Methylobacteriaceae bacterium]
MTTVVAFIHGTAPAFGISFPDFPGCVSGGASLDEAIRRGRETLSDHIRFMLEDGEALPAIRDLDAVKADAEFAADFADAVAVAAIEVDLPAQPVRVNISIDEHLLERIDRAAASAGETRSGFLASAAREKIAAGRL